MFKRNKKDITCYVFIAIFTTIFVFYCFSLWGYDFEVPLFYRDYDNILTAMVTKRWMDISELYSTDLMGAPYFALNIDFPVYGDLFSWIILKTISNITNSYSIAINLFYLSLFPLTALVSYSVMRLMKIKRYLSVSLSIIYTFMPYRFIRNTAHIFLASYWQVPLAILVLYWFYFDDSFLVFNKRFFKNKKNIVTIIILFLIAWTGIYYAFFTAFLIVVVLILKLLNKLHIKQNCLKALFLISNIILPILVAMIPSSILLLKYGKNIVEINRSPTEAEIYGLKITQLFLPNKAHSISFLENILQEYSQAPLPNEGSEYLGLVGIIGLTILFIYLFVRHAKNEALDFFAKLNLSTILLATIGGLGSLFALIVSPLIRSYNRISIFIAYFAVLSVGLFINKFSEKKNKMIVVMVFLIAAISLWDQSFYYSKNEMQQYIDSFYSDEEFVQSIENQVSKNAMIYQIPYISYPESGQTVNAGDYFLGRGYLHSDTLRWSYGDQRGRIGDRWNVAVAQLNLKDRVNLIAHAGFEGIYIDTFALKEKELDELKDVLQTSLNVEPLESKDGRLLFYNMKNYINDLELIYTDNELQDRGNTFLKIIPNFNDGFSSDDENQDIKYFNSEASLKLTNVMEDDIKCKIYFDAKSEEVSTLNITINDSDYQYSLTGEDQAIELEIDIDAYEEIKIDCSIENEENFIQLSNIKIEEM